MSHARQLRGDHRPICRTFSANSIPLMLRALDTMWPRRVQSTWGRRRHRRWLRATGRASPPALRFAAIKSREGPTGFASALAGGLLLELALHDHEGSTALNVERVASQQATRPRAPLFAVASDWNNRVLLAGAHSEDRRATIGSLIGIVELRRTVVVSGCSSSS